MHLPVLTVCACIHCRILSAGTLPSILRILTDVHTATQYDLWSFLLHVRQYSTAKYILEFLRRRYLLTHAGVHETAEELAAEEGPIATDAWEDARHEKFTWMESQLKRHVLGSELFRATTKVLLCAMARSKESDVIHDCTGACH